MKGTLYYIAHSTEASRQKQTLPTDVNTQQKEKNKVIKCPQCKTLLACVTWLSPLQFLVPCTYSNKFVAIILLIPHKNTFKS